MSILTMDGIANSPTRCPTGFVVIFIYFSSVSFFIRQSYNKFKFLLKNFSFFPVFICIFAMV